MSQQTHPRNKPVFPPAELDEIRDLALFLRSLKEPAALLGPDDQRVALPAEVFEVLMDVVTAMQLGQAITVAPLDQALTTQEAANFLGISRPTLVKLLEDGEIPFEQPAPSRHRRVRLKDLLTYQERSRTHRREILSEMVAEESELASINAAEYREALRRVRKDAIG